MVKKIIKGIFLGMAAMVPGVSGGTLAMSLGIYESCIEALSTFTSNPLTSFLILFPYGLGGVLGSLVVCLFIESVFLSYTHFVYAFFIGILIEGAIQIFGKIHLRRINLSSTFAFFSLFSILFFLSYVDGMALTDSSISVSVLNLFLMGILLSLTLVVPGVSGSVLLMNFGLYEPLLKMIKQFSFAILVFDLSQVTVTFLWLAPLLIGMGIGILCFSKTIDYALKHYSHYVNCAILGTLIYSILSLLLDIYSEISLKNIVMTVLISCLGYLLAHLLERRNQ